MTLIQPAWAKLLERVDHLGGDVEARVAGMVSRGPLADIIIDGNTVHFVQPWLAVLNPETKEWFYQSTRQGLSVCMDLVTPLNKGYNRYMLKVPFLGIYMFFPKTGNKLHRSKILGLPKGSTRLLAHYPDLVFDREVVMQICRKHSFLNPQRAISSLPPTATLQDLMEKFHYDCTAEEFLWSYIEAMTGEKDVEHKVY
jgi:hypothetical protein